MSMTLTATTKALWYQRLAAWIERRGGAREIWRNENGEHVLYLKRYYIAKTPWFEIFIHQFFRGDVGPIHDHPFPSFGRILQGGYYEHLAKEIKRHTYKTLAYYDPVNTYKVWREPGFFKWAGRLGSNESHTRGFHKVELRPEDIGKGVVWTLFATGPRNTYGWGFLDDGEFVPFQTQMDREGTTSMQTEHTKYKGWFFPRKVV